MPQQKIFKLRLPNGETVEIVMEPIKRKDIPPPTKEDLEFMLMWNLRLFPFIIENYDKIFKEGE